MNWEEEVHKKLAEMEARVQELERLVEKLMEVAIGAWLLDDEDWENGKSP